MKRLKILITGASGFLGKELCALLRMEKVNFETTDKLGEVDYLGDLSNEEFVNSLPDFDVIINCAAVQYVTKELPFFYRSRYFKKNNIVAMSNLYKKFGQSLSQFIHIGTSMQYLQMGAESYEIESRMKPQGVYSASKLEQHKILANFNCTKSVILPCIIGGKGREGLFIGFVSSIKKYGLAIIPGKGNHPINMVHVKDVSSLIKLVLDNKLAGHFNAASLKPLSINEWVATIGRHTGQKTRNIYIPIWSVRLIAFLSFYRLLAKEQVLMLTYPHVLDIGKTISLGWAPKYDGAEIINDLIQPLLLNK
jgi:nucleoside-diphosphate-sugar epimerase